MRRWRQPGSWDSGLLNKSLRNFAKHGTAFSEPDLKLSETRAMIQPVAGTAEQFKQSFREEAREILVELEAALLELNERPGDSEIVGRIFRGLHTIKGSGSMFGFERMAEFTHDLETAFDRVRNGSLQIGPDLIDLTLAALDQISAMLEEEAGGEPADAGACSQILEDVRRVTGIEESAPCRDDSRAGAQGNRCSCRRCQELAHPFRAW